MLEGSIGTLAAAHAFATLDKLEWHTELFGPLLLTEDILVQPPLYQDSSCSYRPPPGWGWSLMMNAWPDSLAASV
jgi:muconate cycloisomerase